MRNARIVIGVALWAGALAGCCCARPCTKAVGGGTALPPDAAQLVASMGAEQIVEMGAGADGRLKEIEFHVPYATLPEAVRTALETLVPGGEVLDAEVEVVGTRRLYEVTKRIDGREVEVLVDAVGHPVEWESEIDPAAAPPAVLAAARAAVPGNVTAVEEIRDAARRLLAYHVKIDDAGKRYKLALSTSGGVTEVRREMRAEIEVPVR